MTANYLLWALVKPSHWILLAALLTLVGWRRPFGRRLGLATAGLLVLLGVVPTGAWLVRPLETRFATPSVQGDVVGVVVLAGSELPTLSEFHGEPQLDSMGDRLTTFLRLAAHYPGARLVHTGHPREMQVARAVILGGGVAPSRIVFDVAARNTCDSARTAQALVMPRAGEQWLLVTSAFHLPRAVACFRAAGWEITPYPADFRRGPTAWHFDLIDNLADVDLAAHEWLGLVYYRARGYTNELFPAPRPL